MITVACYSLIYTLHFIINYSLFKQNDSLFKQNDSIFSKIKTKKPLIHNQQKRLLFLDVSIDNEYQLSVHSGHGQID